MLVPYNYDYHLAANRKIYASAQSELFKVKTRSDRLKVALINYNYSNYHGYALYKYLPVYIREKYEVTLIEQGDKETLSDFDVICSSHYDGIYNGQHINFELWHGFPIKQMGVMHSNTSDYHKLDYFVARSKQVDLTFSYSQLYTTFINASFPNISSKYRITGMPKNDLLFEKDSLNKLKQITNKRIETDNIIFYLPTWRRGKNNRIETNKEWEKLIGFPDENIEQVIKMLEANDLFLVVKLHPFEFNEYKDHSLFKQDRVLLLEEMLLESKRVHLYELVSSAKLLITDYSSIAFDTLLIDLPIIYAPVDKDEYSHSRGFLLEPYNYFTPGPVVNSLAQLEEQIALHLSGSDPYKENREQIKRLVFQYCDNNASERVWMEIDQYITENTKGR